jgi:hypothetical protein
MRGPPWRGLFAFASVCDGEGVDGSCAWWGFFRVREGAGKHDLERKKGIRWMPWHQEAMKDVARCEKPRGAASRR